MKDHKNTEIQHNPDRKMLDRIDVVNIQIREPVTSIFASFPLLAESINSGDTEKAMDTLQSVYGKSYKLLRGINNMSMGAKLACDNSFSKDAVDLSSLVKSIFQSAQMVLPSWYAQTVDVQDGIIINANKSLVTSALFNLISNSLDYRCEDDVQVSVSLRLSNGRITLIYRDNSIGIKEEIIEKVFQPFFSCNPYNDGEPADGMGVGLYILNQAVVQAGGTVLLQSEFGNGINLVISIPEHKTEQKVVKSMTKDFMLNKYSEMFVQLCEHCTLPDLL